MNTNTGERHFPSTTHCNSRKWLCAIINVCPLMPLNLNSFMAFGVLNNIHVWVDTLSCYGTNVMKDGNESFLFFHPLS